MASGRLYCCEGKEGNSLSLPAETGLSQGSHANIPSSYVQNTPKIQHTGHMFQSREALVIFLCSKTGDPPFLLLDPWPQGWRITLQLPAPNQTVFMNHYYQLEPAIFLLLLSLLWLEFFQHSKTNICYFKMLTVCKTIQHKSGSNYSYVTRVKCQLHSVFEELKSPTDIGENGCIV